MKIEEKVTVSPDKIGVHITGPSIDIMLHVGWLEALALKNGKPVSGDIVVTVKDK